MSTTAEAPLKVPSMSSVDVIRLVYEQFRPVTKKCGPLLAGTVFFQGAEGKLYLTEYQYWLWSSAENTKELTHPEVNVITTPEALLRNLLACTAGKIRACEAHLDRIEQRAEDVPSMIGYYLSNDAEIMTDAFATASLFSLEEPEQWKRIKKSSETK